MITVSWSFDLDRRFSWILPNLNAANSGVNAGQALLKCLCECTGSGWDGVDCLHSSPCGAVFGFVAKPVLITQQCFGYW